ncbi:MFS general substrate transporter [Parathielavia appendiculata]|uniref:MFS general substrate transporter n=1 Tax=Parathielavia appendiculata TaxID=2587402 RepID=A0AAN6U0C3_9PEZI|nr:MFS general substrate transporter [Parathielavia appendiculata]
MATGCVLVIGATFMQTFSPRHNIACFLAGRCIIGIGQGVAGGSYIGELAPPEIRGKIMTFWQTFYSFLIPCIILALLPTIPGSPRWFIQRGNNIEKARAALLEKEAISGSYSALWNDTSLRKRLLLCSVINAGQQLTGQGTLNTYSTKIYQKVFTSSSQIALINALNATFGIIFTLNAIWIIDRFGRKFLLMVGGVGMCVCMVIVAALETRTPSPGGSKTISVGISIVFLLFLFIFFYKPSWGMCSQVLNVANAIFKQFFPIFLDNGGFYAFNMFAGINLLLAASVFFFIPETKQVPLEEIDALFGGANDATQGEEMMIGSKSAQATGIETVENAQGDTAQREHSR